MLNTLKQFICIKNKSTNSHKGFTMMELILILGIIGVIAAFTIPTLIAKCQQYIVSVRLKHTYFLMQDVFSRSEADNGVMSGWGNSYTVNKNESSMDEFFADFVKTYMLPYLKGATLYSDDSKITLRKLGYRYGI